MVAFYLPGGAPVYVFPLLLGAVSTLGLAWAALQAPEKQALPVVSAGISALLGALLIGRFEYAFVNWGYYQENLWEAAQVARGGFGWAGAAAGAAIGLVLYAVIARQPAGKLADTLLPFGLLVAAAAWLGCWLEGSFYGRAVDAWWALPARDEWGEMERRVPLQVIGAALALASFWSVERLRTHLSVPGQAALLLALLLCAEVFILSFLRDDPVPTWKSVHLESWTALVFLASVLAALAAISLKPRIAQKHAAISK